MGLQEVVAEIDRKAKSDAEAILKEGAQKAAEILKGAEKEIEERKALAASDLENVRSASEKRELAGAELKCKKMVQDAKKELLAAAYDGMKAKISEMNGRERAKILERLFERSAAEIGHVGTVYVSGQDVKFAAALFKSKRLAVKEKEMLGGLVAESADGKIFADYSFDSIIDSMKERAIKDLSRILFG